MIRLGKKNQTWIVAGIAAWALFFSPGCKDDSKSVTPAVKPKVVSKSIASPPALSPNDAQKTPGPPGQPVKKMSSSPVPASQQAAKAAETLKAKPSENLAPETAPVTEAQAKQELSQAGSADPSFLFKSDQQYDTKGRVDPFIPLIAEKKAPAPETAPQKAEPKRELTPLEKMDLSQIKLVAVIRRDKGAMAMVEEASGKGYEVGIGTYMGRNSGRVTAIRPEGLVITEHYTDYQGKQRERIQEIKFHRKEGEE